MKHCTLLLTGFLLLTVLPCRVDADWLWVNPVPQGNDLYGIRFFGIIYGIAVGDAGTIMTTNDAGTTWRLRNLTNRRLKDVSFPTMDIGYVCGEQGIVMKTTDGGQHWQLTALPVQVTLNGIQFPWDDQLGYVVGDSGLIAKTTDGGQTWSIRFSNPPINWRALRFIGNDIGYLVGDRGQWRKTSDGGETWLTDSLPIEGNLYALSFPLDQATGYICGDARTVFKTTNAGATWECDTLPGEEPLALRSVCFPIDGNTGFACGDNGVIYRTTDGGNNWQQVVAGSEGTVLHRIHFPGNTMLGFAVGSSGRVLHTTDGGTTWNRLDRGFVEPILDITFPLNLTTGYTATPVGIMKTTDAGSTWHQQSVGGPVTALAFRDELQGCAASVGGIIYHTEDGGTNWRAESCPGVRDNYVALSFPGNGNTGYACAITGAVAKTTDGGLSWFALPAPDTNLLAYTICFLNENEGLIGGAGSVVYRTSDGGASWNPIPTPGHGYRSFCFPPGSPTGFACGFNGMIARSEDRGQSWQLLPSGTNISLTRILFPGPGIATGYAVGEQGTVLYSGDGGVSWQSLNAPVALVNFVALAFPTGPATGYLAGDNGAILKLIPGGSLAELTAEGRPPGLCVSPNPTHGVVALGFALPNPGRVSLKLYDLSGRLVAPATLLTCRSGNHQEIINLSALPAGIYFLEVSAQGWSARARVAKTE